MSVKHHTGQIVIPPEIARPPLVDGTRITIDQAVVETVLREFIIETHPELASGWTVDIHRTPDGAVAIARKA